MILRKTRGFKMGIHFLTSRGKTNCCWSLLQFFSLTHFYSLKQRHNKMAFPNIWINNKMDDIEQLVGNCMLKKQYRIISQKIEFYLFENYIRIKFHSVLLVNTYFCSIEFYKNAYHSIYSNKHNFVSSIRIYFIFLISLTRNSSFNTKNISVPLLFHIKQFSL